MGTSTNKTIASGPRKAARRTRTTPFKTFERQSLVKPRSTWCGGPWWAMEGNLHLFYLSSFLPLMSVNPFCRLFIKVLPHGTKVDSDAYKNMILIPFVRWLSTQEGVRPANLYGRDFVFQQGMIVNWGSIYAQNIFKCTIFGFQMGLRVIPQDPTCGTLVQSSPGSSPGSPWLIRPS